MQAYTCDKYDTYANAGHECPVIKGANGRFEQLKEKHGFVIGGFGGLKYKQYELTLEKGSKLFLHTDGVTEATDKDGQNILKMTKNL